MRKSLAKKLLSLVICILMIAMSTVYAFAVETEKSSIDFKVLDESFVLENNQIAYTSYNITENSTWGFMHTSANGKDNQEFMYGELVDGIKIFDTIPNETYNCYYFKPEYLGMSSRGIYLDDENFSNSGGLYRKVRVKLSDLDDYFNEDGSHSREEDNLTGDIYYYFGDDENIGENRFSSTLIIVSDSCVNAVAPDENGYVEFYTATKIGYYPHFYTNYEFWYRDDDNHWRAGGGGGINGVLFTDLQLGSVNASLGVSISDATYTQMYIAKFKEFDHMQYYRADVDGDGKINIIDATKIQLYVSKYDYK